MFTTAFTSKKATLIVTCFVFLICVAFFVHKQIAPSPENRQTDKPKQEVQSETKKEKPFTIVAFGDSLTAGYGVELSESYPALLEKELLSRNKNISVINMGVSGETTTASLDRVDFVISQQPSLVLLGIGANDMLRSSSPEIARANLKTILQRFKDKQITVVILGMKSVASNGEAYRDVFDDMYPSLAQEYNFPLVPFFLDGVALDPTLNTADGVHPNKAGYEKIIEKNILPVLLPVLSVEMI